MRTLIALIYIALAVAGCSTLRPITVGVNNPVTPAHMYQVEQTMVAVVSGLNTYRSLCVEKVIPQNCRDVIEQIQSFTKPAEAQLRTLRAYVKNNDRLNAVNAYNTLVALLADARGIAKANGVAVP